MRVKEYMLKQEAEYQRRCGDSFGGQTQKLRDQLRRAGIPIMEAMENARKVLTMMISGERPPVATPGDMARAIEHKATEIQLMISSGKIDVKEIDRLLWHIRHKALGIQGALGELFREEYVVGAVDQLKEDIREEKGK